MGSGPAETLPVRAEAELRTALDHRAAADRGGSLTSPPSRVKPGALLLAGDTAAQAVVRVVAIDEDGQVHFSILPGSVEKNRHLLERAVS